MSAALDRSAILSWQQIHESLQQLAVERASRDYEIGRQLLAALRNQVHLHLGFGSFSEYVERLLGMTPRQSAERLRVAHALEELPQTQRASQTGAVCWSVIRELTRVATAQTEAEWLKAAETRTVRQVEQLVSGRQPGDRPSDPSDPSARRELLRFEVTAEVAATWREAVSELQRRAGPTERLSEEDALLLMARMVLGGPADEGRSSYQVALTLCESCGRGWQQSRGELVAVGSEIVEMACCDAQHIGDVSVHGPVVGAAADTHVGADADTHVGAHSATKPPPPSGRRARRASQTISPRVRRAVIRRQIGCCAVPGCRHSQYLDLHHIVPRSEGGSSEEDDLVGLCGSHHRAAHRGFLIIDGQPSTGLTFFHADGTEYGGAVSARAVDVYSSVFDALKRLGYKESDVRRALMRVRTNTHVGTGRGAKSGGAEGMFDKVIRAAFEVLAG